MSVGVWWSGCSGDGDEVMCGGLMCVWRMAVSPVCVCRMHLHNRVCGMCGVCGMVCVAWCVWHGVCVAWHVGWRVAGRGGLINQLVSA
jgi:hypothetical protein